MDGRKRDNMIKMVMLVIATAGVTEVDVKEYTDYSQCVTDAKTYNQSIAILSLQKGPDINFQCSKG